MKAIEHYLKVVFKKAQTQPATSLNTLSPNEMATLVSSNINIKQPGSYWWIEDEK